MKNMTCDASKLQLTIIGLVLLATGPHICRLESCPQRCLCSGDFRSVDCRLKGLSAFPRGIPQSSRGLHLDLNNISGLPRNLYFPRLEWLTLKSNRIRSLTGLAFSSLEKLQRLDLSHNHITHLTGNEWSFNPLLEDINLSGNEIKTLPLILIVGLSNLRRLNVSDNLISKLLPPQNLQKSFPTKSVTRLDLRFTIDLSGNNISDDSAAALKLFHLNLKELDLSNNARIQFKELKALLRSLGHSKIKTLKIRNLKLIYLPQFLFHDVFLPIASSLDLSSNYLSHLEEHSLTPLDSLKTLSLNHNMFNTNPDLRENRNLQTLNLNFNKIFFIKAEYFPPVLRKIDLSNNKLSTISEEMFSRLKYLSTLNIAFNEIVKVQLNGKILHQLKVLDISGNMLYRRYIKEFIDHMPNLTHLDVSKNRMECLWTNMTSPTPNLRHFNVSSNNITQLSEFELASENLEILDLSHNNLHILFNYNAPKLKELYLHNNRISNIDARAFMSTRELRVLDASDNPVRARVLNLWRAVFTRLANSLQVIRLKSFEIYPYLRNNHWQFFVNFPKLVELNLWNCSIHEAPVFFDLLPRSLVHLDLGHNRIASIAATAFAGLTSVETINLAGSNIHHIEPDAFRHLNRLREVNVVGNPLICDCLNLPDFISWSLNTNVTVVGLYGSPKLRCAHPKKLLGQPVTLFHPKLCSSTQDNAPMLTGIGAAFLLILIFGLPYVVVHFISNRRRMSSESWLNLASTENGIRDSGCAAGGGSDNGRKKQVIRWSSIQDENDEEQLEEL